MYSANNERTLSCYMRLYPEKKNSTHLTLYLLQPWKKHESWLSYMYKSEYKRLTKKNIIINRKKKNI